MRTLTIILSLSICLFSCKKENEFTPTNTPTTLNYQLFTSSNSGLASNNINSITKANNNTIWIATNDGITAFDGTIWTTYDSLHFPFPSNVINTIISDNNGVIWAGTNNGLLKFDGTV
ncbi:MAG: hypothetical protein L6Q66_02905, partial [Bacteroidia bacterium]|nr:hypothetical protein [Bacteroidia bacterium]